MALTSGLASISGQTAIGVKCPVCNTSGQFLPINVQQTDAMETKYSANCIACSNVIILGMKVSYSGLPGKAYVTQSNIEAYWGSML